jgi:hypothetical protein
MSVRSKRSAIIAAAAAVVAVAAAGPSGSTGQTQDPPGLTYGGLKDTYGAWLRLAPGRLAVASMQMDWAVAPERCSNRRTYSSTLYAGFEEFSAITVSEAGSFKRTVVDRYTDDRGRHEEHQTVQGTISGEVATGTIRGRVRLVRPDGQVVRCDFGPQRWRLVD